MDNVEKMKTAMIKNIKIGQNYRSTMSAVLDQLKNISNVNKDNFELRMLGDLFGETAEIAIDLVKQKAITYFHWEGAPSSGLYQVSSPVETVNILRNVNMCPCSDFRRHVETGNNITCPHVLACHIAEALNTVDVCSVDTDQWTQFLQECMGLS